jgi:hypothetical protein
MSGLLYESAHKTASLANQATSHHCSSPAGDVTIKSPARKCRESNKETDESRQGRHNPTSDYPGARNPSLFKPCSHESGGFGSMPFCAVPAGLDHFSRATRHFRAGLLIVPSLRDLAQRCDIAWFAKGVVLCADSWSKPLILSYETQSSRHPRLNRPLRPATPFGTRSEVFRSV